MKSSAMPLVGDCGSFFVSLEVFFSSDGFVFSFPDSPLGFGASWQNVLKVCVNEERLPKKDSICSEFFN